MFPRGYKNLIGFCKSVITSRGPSENWDPRQLPRLPRRQYAAGYEHSSSAPFGPFKNRETGRRQPVPGSVCFQVRLHLLIVKRLYNKNLGSPDAARRRVIYVRLQCHAAALFRFN